MKKERIYSLNLIRGMAAIAVFLYHGYYNMGCDYKVLNHWIKHAPIWMTLFFVLSGVVLRYTYSETKFHDLNTLKPYFKKRILSIFPIYLLIQFVYMYLNLNIDVYHDIVVAPFQLLGLHEFSHYPYLMNSGVWFFSCIFFCYLIFPYLNNIISELSKKQVLKFGALLLFLCITSPFLGEEFSLNLYTNVFIRIVELALGMCLVRFIELTPEKDSISRYSWIVVFPVFFISIYFIHNSERVLEYGSNINRYGSVLCVALLYSCIVCKNKILLAISKSRIVTFFSDYSLEFWCATFFTATLSIHYRPHLSAQHFNMQNVILSFVLNIFIALLLKLYLKSVKFILNKFSAKKVIVCVAIAFVCFIGWKSYVAYGTHDTYDLTEYYIDTTKNMQGIYHDEGEYAWTDQTCIIEFCSEEAKTLYITMSTSTEDLAGTLSCRVYINDHYVQDVSVSDAIETHAIDILKDVYNKDSLEVRLEFDKSFSPSRLIPGNTDDRELAARLHKISCE